MSPSSDAPENVLTLDRARSFKLTKILSDDPQSRTLFVLGTLRSDQAGREEEEDVAIIKIEKTAFDTKENSVVQALLERLGTLDSLGGNDIYFWARAWLPEGRASPDLKLMVICPATDIHIRKYSAQTFKMVKESPEMYESVVKPWIESIPPSRTQWVRNILSGVSEADKVVYASSTFMLLPDAKWDQTTLSTLYLTILVKDPSILCLRSLRGEHLPLLREMRSETERAVLSKWPGMEKGSLRFFVHYQPSYYHFHVHVTHIAYAGSVGMSVGQAHLLDDIISLLEIDSDVFAKMNLSYVVGEQHGLWPLVREAV